MIDLATEEIMTLSQVPAILPPRRAGRNAHVSCIYRWTSTGFRGVVLESVQIGGTRCTSKEALFRFFAELTRLQARPPPALSVSAAAGRQREVERAERQLDAEGV